MQNLDKVNPSVPETYLNIGDGFNLLIGGVYKLIIGALGTGGMTNSAKISIRELWETIASTWATETRTWNQTASLISNSNRYRLAYSSEIDLTNISSLGQIYGDFAKAQYTEGIDGLIEECTFGLGVNGNPSGPVYAQIYNGVVSSGSVKPTGAPLATSDVVSIRTIQANYSRVSFVFSGENRISVTKDQKYCVSIHLTGGDINNSIYTIQRDSPDNTGKSSYYYPSLTSWFTNKNFDLQLEVNCSTKLTNITKP